MRSRLSALFLFALGAFLLASAPAPALDGDKVKGSKKAAPPVPPAPGTDTKIDLLTADPKQVGDLSNIDPARLDLTKEKVKQIDLNKWDLSKIDISKVADPLAAKWIVKVLREKKELEKTLSKYKPGELEQIQKDNLKWLERPAPLAAPPLSRTHAWPQKRVQEAAKALDELVAAKLAEAKRAFNPLTTDEQFVRRIYLDAAGRIPTAAEAQAFLEDKSPNKRRDLIDKLLLGKDYPSQMFNWLANMMRVRELKGNQGDNSAYQAWLMDQVAGNRPWDRTVYDLLTAEGNLVTQPAVGWLVRDSGMPLDSLSITLTTFMGANIACAQCHDHPTAEYTQKNFYELAAFFGATDVPGRNVRGEPKVLKDHFHSVTTQSGKYLTFPKDYKYPDAKPNARVTPAFATLTDVAPRLTGTPERPLGRKDFADWMTSPQNVQFAATVANRLWGKAFGRAVLEPVTEMDDLDKADDPRLIKAIAALMRELKFDLMAFQRVVYNSRAYQSQASVTPPLGAEYYFPGPTLRRMTAEQTWDSFVALTEGERVNDAHRDRRTLAWSHDVFKPGATAALPQGGGAKRIEFELLIKEAEKLSQQLRASTGGPRSTKGTKKNAGANDLKDGTVVARASERAQPEADSHFLRQFGQSERDLADSGTTEGGIPQALLLLNGNEHKILSKADSYIMKRVAQAKTDAERVDFLYLSFLGRRATAAERGFIAAERIEPKDLIWILVNKREFLFVQ